MIEAKFDDISADHIRALIENEIREGRTIEYKERLPGDGTDDRREFLVDVSSFANASGGDILYGVTDKRDGENKPTGVPARAAGLGGCNIDAEVLRLEALIRDGISPRVQQVRVRSVDGFDDGPIMIVRIPRSWESPHMVSFRNHSRFYSRNSAGKYQLDVAEIRSAFAVSEALPERIRRFRDDRLARIVADETPALLFDEAKIVMHAMPLASFSGTFQLDPAAMGGEQERLEQAVPFGRQRYNIDGYLLHGHPDQSGKCYGYCQIFRNGVIEWTNADMLRTDDGQKEIASAYLEDQLIKTATAALASMKSLDAPLPIVVMLAMLGVRGFTLYVDRRRFTREAHPIDRDTLIFPDVAFEDYESDVPTTLRPIIDALWNACGFRGSPYYSDDGVRTPPR